MKLPWQPLDPDGDGILARVVHDAGTEHVAVFESAQAARAACDAVNRGEGRESELRETAGELERAIQGHAVCLTRAILAEERVRKLEAELRETAEFVEQPKARIDRGNALRATADGRVSELEMALENTVASARGRGERVLAAESALRTLQERVEKALVELECIPNGYRLRLKEILRG